MRNSLVYQILVATIPGAILLALGFYVFTKEPVDLSADVTVSYFHGDIASAAIRDAAMKIRPDVDFKDPEVLQRFNDNIVFGDTVNLSVYRIENKGEHVVADLKIVLSRFIYGYVSDQKDFKVIDSGADDVAVSLLPRSVVTVVLVNSYGYSSSPERFILDDKALPVLSLNGEFNDPIAEIGPYLRAYSWAIGFFALIGVVGVFLIIYAICVEAIFGRHLGFIASNFDNRHIARILAAFTHLHHEDPERYRAIVERAERLYKKWVAHEKSDAV